MRHDGETKGREAPCPFSDRNKGFSVRKWGFGIVLSCLRFRNSVESESVGGTGIGDETIAHWHVINAIYARIPRGNLMAAAVFVLPACAPFIKRRQKLDRRLSLKATSVSTDPVQ